MKLKYVTSIFDVVTRTASRMSIEKFLQEAELSPHINYASLKNDKGRNALFVAVCVNNLGVVKILLSRPYFLSSINTQDIDGNSMLHYAAIHNNLQMTKLLMRSGIETDIRNKAGKTAYDLSQGPIKKYFEKTEKLLPKVVVNDLWDAIGVRTLRKSTMINLVKRAGSLTERNLHGRTFLHEAIVQRNVQMVIQLMAQGACITDTDRQGNTCLHLASLYDPTYELVRILILEGMNPWVKNKEGKFFWEHLMTKSYFKCDLIDIQYPKYSNHLYTRFNLLVAMKRDLPKISAQDKKSIKNLSSSQIVLNHWHCTRINAQTDSGETLLHYAVERTGSFKIVRELIQHGVDPSIKDKFGISCWDRVTKGNAIIYH